MNIPKLTVQELVNFLNSCDPDAPIAISFDQSPEWKAEIYEMWKENGIAHLSLRLRELREEIPQPRRT